MGIVSDAIGGIGDAIGGITDSLFGGDQKPVESANFAPRSHGEQLRLDAIENQINSLYNKQSTQASGNDKNFNDVSQLFQKQLTQFLAGGSSNPNPTPDQLNQATSFVDQTFTNPAQTALNQYGSDFQSQAQGRAAALGRNPNSDIATQQAIAGEIAKQGLGLQAERGSRIAQTASALNSETYNRGLGSLNAGMQGGGYLNNLAQQAFTNQVNLQNARTGLAGIYQNDRGQKGVAVNTSPGLLGNITSGIGQIGDVFEAGKSLLGSLRGKKSSTDSNGNITGEYTSSTGGIGKGLAGLSLL